ncbi:hypothetical protein Tco_0591039 [Tanacetum coccineum]
MRILDARVMMGDVESSRFLFDKNPVKNEVSWNVLIDGYKLLDFYAKLLVSTGDVKSAQLMNGMKKGTPRLRSSKALKLLRQVAL